ncbi:hypothetical protein [Noviherbaspirillum soli]|uniref:hypothetical protein n=1 Tax=Noviherbaspirillum soli TaxID=1064518 RepID=UPI00188D6E9B|nr:hypothetical protein [Noviherbaspirillum soli]
MRSWTGIEIAAERERLEREAASILGHMLFEYSRLDMDLGLMLVWADDGKRLEKLTTEHNESNFYYKLRFLEKEASIKYANSPDALTAHAGWLVDAHKVRECRNKLVHGRWGIEPTRRQVVNVVGLPTSPEQTAYPYTIRDLQAELDGIKALRASLDALRKAWPI